MRAAGQGKALESVLLQGWRTTPQVGSMGAANQGKALKSVLLGSRGRGLKGGDSYKGE